MNGVALAFVYFLKHSRGSWQNHNLQPKQSGGFVYVFGKYAELFTLFDGISRKARADKAPEKSQNVLNELGTASH